MDTASFHVTVTCKYSKKDKQTSTQKATRTVESSDSEVEPPQQHKASSISTITLINTYEKKKSRHAFDTHDFDGQKKAVEAMLKMDSTAHYTFITPRAPTGETRQVPR